MASTPVVSRLSSCINLYSIKDYENAFINLFIALDITAKKRYPNLKVGKRNRALLLDTEPLTQKLYMGIIIQGLNINGLTFSNIFYKFGRNALIHDGQLDRRLSISDEKGIRISEDNWDFHHSYIMSMAISIISCKENANENFNTAIEYECNFGKINLNDLWGKESELMEYLQVAS
ncbi:TPA: hypothetical protein I3798_000857 [Enterobacter cloacae]|nr:hypothetical protein [Enterobacter cloacae]HAS1117494.1 hypothetical protein [Enterobacter cloacae]